MIHEHKPETLDNSIHTGNIADYIFFDLQSIDWTLP